MNLSSILIFTSPDNLQTVHANLCALPGVEVHYQCHDTGRLVVIQEAPDNKSEMDGLQRIKALPQVIAAEMVYHHVDDNTGHNEQAPAMQDGCGGTSSWA
jgi:periplasmic nitrate reductase NapD